MRYAGVVRNHLLPTFGTTPLTEIAREAIKRMMYDKRAHEGLTPSSVRQILAPLREMFNHAVEDGILASNPAARVGRFLQQRQEPKTVDIYGHLVPGGNRAAVDRLDDAPIRNLGAAMTA